MGLVHMLTTVSRLVVISWKKGDSGVEEEPLSLNPTASCPRAKHTCRVPLSMQCWRCLRADLCTCSSYNVSIHEHSHPDWQGRPIC